MSVIPRSEGHLDMRSSDDGLRELAGAIVVGDTALFSRLLSKSPALAHTCFEIGATRRASKEYYVDEIGRYIFSGDTALHFAAAAYRVVLYPTADANRLWKDLGAIEGSLYALGVFAPEPSEPRSPRWEPGAN
jgi:hypothetical protein